MDKLPNGWKANEFGELFDIKGGSQPDKRYFVYEPQAGYIRLLQIRDFGENPVPTFVPINMVTKFCEQDDILIARYGASIGRILTGQAGAYNVALVKMLIDRSVVSRQFVYYWLNTDYFQHRVQSNSRSAQNGFNKEDLSPLIFPLPPLAEQHKIAAILGTWDAAIATVEQLIAALQARKQGLMQRLLTGEVRFPEFEGSEWPIKKLSDLFERVNRKNTSGNTNVLTASAQHGLVSQIEYFNRSVAGADLANYCLLRKGEFAYNRSSSDGYPFGAIKQLERYEEGILSTLYICFRMIDGAGVPNFYKHYFESGGLNQGIYMIAQEGARNHGLLNVGLSDFFDVDVVAPSFEEQTRIEQVFELQEQLIDTAKRRHAAMVQQKQALMQQLLTGQVRVKIDKAIAD